MSCLLCSYVLSFNLCVWIVAFALVLGAIVAGNFTDVVSLLLASFGSDSSFLFGRDARVCPALACVLLARVLAEFEVLCCCGWMFS